MLNCKKAAAIALAAAMAAQPAAGFMAMPASGAAPLYVRAAEVGEEDDDPGRERLGGHIIPAELAGISQYAIRRSSISGNSPFVADTIYFHSDAFEGRNIANGVDVSKYQNDIDWEAAAAAGVEYAIVRVGYRGYGAAGGMAEDNYYKQNIEGAISAGIAVGVYIFSQATTEKEAVEEAEYILDRISGYSITLPVVMDFEYASVNGSVGGRLYDAKLSKDKATKVCLAFCEAVESAGYEPMLYANSVMLNNQLNASEISSRYKIWLAHYTSMTSYTGDYDFWQYTSGGTVDGIPGRVDCNFWYQKDGEATPPGTNQPDTPDFPDEIVDSEAPVEQVTGLAASGSTDSQIRLVWDALSGVSGYEVYRYDAATGIYDRIQTIGNAKTTSYTDTGLAAGVVYEYMVRAYRQDSSGSVTYGEYSQPLSANTAPKAAEGFSAGGRTTTRIRLNWEAAEGVTGYRIYRYNGDSKKYEKVKTISDSVTNTWVDTKAEPGESYTYAIKTYIKNDTGTYWSQLSEGVAVKAKPAKVEGFSLTVARKDKVRLGWKRTPGADGYRIYRYNSKTKAYEKVKTIGSGDTLTWVNSGLSSQSTYKYKIAAYVEDGDKARYAGAESGELSVRTK